MVEKCTATLKKRLGAKLLCIKPCGLHSGTLLNTGTVHTLDHDYLFKYLRI
jgi:hypothetical protein